MEKKTEYMVFGAFWGPGRCHNQAGRQAPEPGTPGVTPRPQDPPGMDFWAADGFLGRIGARLDLKRGDPTPEGAFA